jgi:nucleotide-binding universal stress UspA family protein
MDKALVVARSDEDRPLIHESALLADGVGADLVVLYLLSEEEFNNHIDMLDEIESYENMQGGDPTEEELATDLSEGLYNKATADSDIEIDVKFAGIQIGKNPAQTVIETAQDCNCDHIFITGRKRSPTGKALFGDTTQSVLMGFDGYVTVKLKQ